MCNNVPRKGEYFYGCREKKCFFVLWEVPLEEKKNNTKRKQIQEEEENSILSSNNRKPTVDDDFGSIDQTDFNEPNQQIISPSIDSPLCKCGNPSKRLVVRKDGENKGKAFFGCNKPQNDGSCKFFMWENAWEADKGFASDSLAKKNAPIVLKTDQQTSTPPSDFPPCKCGNESKRLVVKKEGKNKGRAFYVCQKSEENGGCGFFFWETCLEPGNTDLDPLPCLSSEVLYHYKIYHSMEPLNILKEKTIMFWLSYSDKEVWLSIFLTLAEEEKYGFSFIMHDF